MFSFFKKPPKQDDDLPYSTNDGETIIDAYEMTLDERKAWRLDMIHKSIRDVLSDLDITTSMYRYRTIAIDERGHYYAIMISPTLHFSLSGYARTDKLILIENLLKSQTFDYYGIVVDGVYWQATDNIDVLKHASKPRAESLTKSKKTIDDLTKIFSDPSVVESQFSEVSKKDAVIFRDAIAKGIRPPPFHIGGKQYNTNLAPLGPQ